MKPKCETTPMKAFEQYFLVILFTVSTLFRSFLDPPQRLKVDLLRFPSLKKCVN